MRFLLAGNDLRRHTLSKHQTTQQRGSDCRHISKGNDMTLSKIALTTATAALIGSAAYADKSTRYYDMRADTSQSASVAPNAASEDQRVVRGETVPNNTAGEENIVTYSSRNAPFNPGYQNTYSAGGVGPYNDSR
jgi:hypothetical protein